MNGPGSGTILGKLAAAYRQLRIRLRQQAVLAAAFAINLSPHTSAAASPAETVPAVAERCISCHSPEGIADAPDTPYLGGQPVTYLSDAIESLRSNRRPSSTRNHIPATLTAQQARPIAEYFSTLSEARAAQVTDAAQAAIGQGIHADRCENCHEDEGRATDYRGLGAPLLAGQSRNYLLRQLNDFVSGQRSYPIRMMRGAFAGEALIISSMVIRRAHRALAPGDLEALAHFYAGLDLSPPPRVAQPPADPPPKSTRRRR